MTDTELVIAGAGPAGHSAAAAYRRAGGTGRVTILSAEGHEPYERPPLSKELLRGEKEPDQLPIESPGWYADHSVEIRRGAAAVLSPGGRTVSLADGGSLRYDELVIATGAEPVRPPVDGVDLQAVHVLRSRADALRLRAAAGKQARAVVVGSGFIGCEAATSLRARDCAVELLTQESKPQLDRLGDAVAERLSDWLQADGVACHYDAELEAIEQRKAGVRVRASFGEVDADLVLLASGVRASTDFLEDSGIELSDAGEVTAGSDMRTATAGVLACGDCCRAEHSLAGRPLHVEHWGDALAQGAVAGTTAAGHDASWTEVPGFWSTIGGRTLKYAAWGDGYDEVEIREQGDGAFTAWYSRHGSCAGVLTHRADADYEDGRRRIAAGEPPP